MKKNFIKKVFAATMCGIVLFGSAPSVDAATKKYTRTITRKTGFSKAWQKNQTVTFNVDGLEYYALITYGYDTFCVKEDYVQGVGGMPRGCSSCGTVKNSKGTKKNTNKVKGAGLSRKADVKHTGVPVKYMVTMWFE